MKTAIYLILALLVMYFFGVLDSGRLNVEVWDKDTRFEIGFGYSLIALTIVFYSFYRNK